MAVKNGIPDDALGELYPFEDKTVTLADGTCMHYIEMGRAGLRRPTFLLLHGIPSWSFMFRKVVEPLSRFGRVIAVDHVGLGRSDHPADPEYHTLEQHIANLEEFASALSLKRVIPVVQDWGGPIGLGYATRNPDKLAGLVILNTWAFVEGIKLKPPLWWKALRAPKVGELQLGRRNMLIERFMPRLISRTMTLEEMAGYRHPFATPASRAALVGGPRMVPLKPSDRDWNAMLAVERALPELDVPALIVWGARDRVFPGRFAKHFFAVLPQAEAPVFLPEAGHFVPEDAPEALGARIADFVHRI